MLNSKMKRSMAWIMTAAVVMSAAPVSAADFSSEEVTAEAAESEDTVISEENTDAVDESAEEDFASVDMAEDDADSADVAVEEESTDDAGEAFVSDGSEAENAETEDVVDDGTMTAEELADAFAVGTSDDDAPHSSVESLPVGKYENATVNLYVPGSLNKVLPGVNAYLTNSANPMGLENAPFGTPTDPVFNNATLQVLENGKIEVTVDVMNPAFELIHVKDGSNIHVKEIKRKDSYYIDNELADKVKMEDGTYQGRITQLTLELDDFSGLYTFGDCVEFALPTYNESTPDVDQRWKIPLNLAIDFEELQSGQAYTTKTWFNENVNLGLTARARNLENVTGGVEEITSGDEYSKFQEYFNEHADAAGSFRMFKVDLRDENGNLLDINKYRVRFVGSVAFPPVKDAVLYQWEDGNLSPRMTTGSTIGEFDNGDEVDDPFDAVFAYSGWNYGYIVSCSGNSNMKYEKTFSDSITGMGAVWHSNDKNAYKNNTVDGKAYTSSTSNTDSYKIETYFVGMFKKNAKLGDTALNEFLNKKMEGEYQKLLVTGTYAGTIYSKIPGTSNSSYQYDLAPSRTKGVTYMELLLPLEEVTGKTLYKVSYNKATEEYTDAEKVEYTETSDGKASVQAIDKDTSITVQYNQWLKYYLACTADNVLDDKNKVGNIAEFFVVVTEGAIAEKPSAPTSEFTYDGTEKTVVPASDYYTVEGTSSAKLPGSYKVTVTLKDGYAWKDGTTDPIEFTWSIKALQTAKPAAVTGLTYNGQNQAGVKSGTGYNLAGTYTAKNAGSYKAKVLLAEGYEWSDGTTDPLTLTWSISKADQTVTTKVATKSYKFTSLKKKAASFTIGASGQGSISYKVVKAPSKASKYITVDKNGKVTLKKGAKVGTYTISVIAAGNENYNAGSKDVTIKVNKLTQKITAKVSKKTVKASSVKKKAKTFSIGAKAKTTVSYKVVKTPDKAKKYISVNKKGKVTIKKKAPKGTYEIKVTAKANGTYNTATRTIKVVVK